MIPSDAVSTMLAEPTIGPQTGAGRQRSRYASSSVSVELSVIGQGAGALRLRSHLRVRPRTPGKGRGVGTSNRNHGCVGPQRWTLRRQTQPVRPARSTRCTPRRFFNRRLPLTRPQSVFLPPASKSDRRGRAKGRTTARGYGNPHQKLRKALERKVASGGIRCWRCGELIRPGEAWDLGHDDDDRRRYRGPEHARCNRATASRRRRRWQSREW